MERQADFGGFMGSTFDILGRNANAVLIFLLVVGGGSALGLMLGLVDASDSIAGLSMGFSVDATDDLASVGYELLLLVVTVVASYLLLARYLESVGRLPDRSTRIWAYVGMSILSTLAVVLGLVLLIVPGIILLVRWSAASGFLVGSRTGVVEALEQSWNATRGHSWPIFGAALVLFLLLAIAAGVIGGIAGVTGSDLAIAIVSGFAEAFGNAASLAFAIGVYLLVHDDTGDLANTFE